MTDLAKSCVGGERVDVGVVTWVMFLPIAITLSSGMVAWYLPLWL